jgi:hypothetical protein
LYFLNFVRRRKGIAIEVSATAAGLGVCRFIGRGTFGGWASASNAMK